MGLRSIVIVLAGLSGIAACGFQIASSGGGQGSSVTGDSAVMEPTGDPACAAMWSYAASNFDPCAQGETIKPALILGPGTYRYTPITGVLEKNNVVEMNLPTTGSSPRVLSLEGLTLEAGAVVRIAGDVPLIISVHGDASISGVFDASARGSTSGPGGGVCAGGRGADALASPPAWSAGGGGGGGAFGSDGAAGGTGDTEPGNAKTPGGAPMVAQGDPTLVPLRGGCTGGAGGEEDPSCMSSGTPGGGGGGGGAFQLTVRETLLLSGSAQIAANGGGGGKGVNGPYTPNSGGHVGVGGGGGGSGGGILVEGARVMIAQSASLCANGGGGGGGTHNNDGPIGDGFDGACALAAASGGAGVNAFGGSGAFGAIPALQGAPGSRQDDGGGGGGGGVGRIRIRAAMSPAPSGFLSTPAALVN